MTTISRLPLPARAAIVGAALIGLSGCVTDSVNPLPDTSFREARFEQMQKLKGFEQCRNEGLQLDADARTRSSTGAFLTSAAVLAKCTDELGTAASAVPQEELMRINALSVVNYFKGGDVEMARRRFDGFKAAWPDHDLYLTGGTSFVATVETLLGRTESQSFGRFLALNVTQDMKSEMRRMNHWKNK